MKTTIRSWVAGALAMLLIAALPVAAQAQQYFWWQVIDERGEPYTGQNVQCSVFRPNVHAAILLHTTSGLTAGGNSPLFSDSGGKLHFYSTSTDPVDVTCFYANGGSAQINKLDRFTHKVVIPRQAGVRVARFAINNVTTATNQSSGITIPSGAVVRDVIIQNLNPQGLGTYHVSVGFAGNHAVAANVNALVSAQALSSPNEWLRPHVIMTGTGLNERVDVSHRGLALQRFIAGHGSAAGSVGLYAEVPYLVHVASGLDVTYAVNPGTGAGARVHVFIIWENYHTGVNRLGLTN